MKSRISRVLAAIGALAALASLSGCILVEKGGHGGHCAAPPFHAMGGGHWGHGR